MSRRHPDETDEATDDPILERVLSDSAYDRVRTERFSHFKQPVARKLAVQSALLGVLALALPLYLLYPSDAAAYLPSTDPATASPIILFIGAFALVVQLGTAALLAGSALYRVRNEPLTEDQAIEAFNVENFAAYFGFGTGGLAIVMTMCMLALGLGGESTLGAYVETMDGTNPFASSIYALPLGLLGTTALAASAVVLAARWYVGRRFERL